MLRFKTSGRIHSGYVHDFITLSQIMLIGERQLDTTYQTVTAVSWFDFT